MHSVREALMDQRWIGNINAVSNVQGVVEFLHLAEIMNTKTMAVGGDDTFTWIFSESGT